ncbi:MAG: cytochrome c biogenesis protein CcsA [Elusimicrobia bacterium]|nr:cytochrome c biogenesis protein CcsA [Elusimicrobiota bacterium]
MKKHMPWLLPAALVLLMGAASLPPKNSGPIDVEAFARLPALQNGRIKPLDTIARNALLILRGKQSLKTPDKRLSPGEWLLDMAARPERADGYKVFVIYDPDVLGLMGKEQTQEKYFAFDDLKPFLEAVQHQAEQADKIEPKLRSRFQAAVANLNERLVLYQKLQNTFQISGDENFPDEIRAYAASLPAALRALRGHQAGGKFDQSALMRLAGYFKRFEFLSDAAYFLPLPPAEGDSPDDWQNMGAGLLKTMKTGELHPAIGLYAEMLRAYRAADAAAFERSLSKVQTWLAGRIAKPASLAGMEYFFNAAQPFYKGILLYVAVLLLSFAAWLVWPQALGRGAFHLLLWAFTVHTAGLAFRILLQGRPPVTNLYSSAIFVGWVAALLGIVLERITKKGIGTVAAATVGALTLVIAHHLASAGDTMEMMQAVLDSNFWLATHVVAITIGYASTFLAGALAHVYIFRGLLTRSLNKSSAKTLTQMTYGIVCFSLFFSFVGTVLGGIWADQSWGRFWGWDPKENGALLIVLWNAIILHARWGGYIRQRGLMLMAVFGDIVTSLSWFGVNMLGIGLHSYGFMDQAFYWLAAFVAAQAAVIACGSLPPRYWRSPSTD